MNKLIFIDFLREIKKSLGRFLSIFFIVLVGVGFFTGIKAAVPDMQHTADVFYDESELYDLRVISTMGLTEDDITAMRETPGILTVESGYFADAISRVGTRDVVFRVHSMPKTINKLDLTEGRLPSKSDECVIEDSKNIEIPVKIGDTISLSSGSDYKKIEEELNRDSYTVVGKVRSADYLTFQKGFSEIGSGVVDFFMMVPEENFAFPVYIEALIQLEGAKELNSFSKAYEQKVSLSKNTIENIGADRSIERAEELKKEAEKELAEGKKQYETEEARFESEIAAAEKEVEEANNKLVSGEAKLETEKESFERLKQQSLRQIQESETQLAQAQAQYDETNATYQAAMSQYGGLINGIASVSADINNLYNNAVYQKGQLEGELNDVNLSDEDRQNKQVLLDGYSQLIYMVDEANSRTGDLGNVVGDAVSNAESQLSSAQAQLDEGRSKLNAAKSELAAATTQAEAEFAQARKDLDAGWKELEEAQAELAKEKEKGEKALREAREKIIRTEAEIERLSSPSWYVLDRNSNVGLMSYKTTTQKVDALASIFPVLFIFVAGLVCLTSMTRMVDEQRTIIGLYKALGYSIGAISFKFVVYAGIASILGGIIGSVLGMSFFPEAIFNAWSMMYIIPTFYSTPQWLLAIISITVAVISMVGVSYYAINNELHASPASLMRPKAPVSGKKILLEKWTYFWKKLSFMQKVTTRNIFRYKKRFWMTVAGITGCTALLLAGFGISDSVSSVIENQFEDIYNYQMMVQLSPEADPGEATEKIEAKLDSLEEVESWQRAAQYNVEVRNTGDAVAVNLIIPESTENFGEYVKIRKPGNGEVIEPKGGVVLSEKLARLLKVVPGDFVEITVRGIKKKVEVQSITEQYIFHYMYMDSNYYEELFRLPPFYKDYLLKNKAGIDEGALSDELLSDKNVSSALVYSNLAKDFEEQVKSLNAIVLLIIVSAGILAFVVLYNLININISERIREIATIKVLGFYDKEVSSYVFREIFILSLFGSFIGLFLGIGLHRIVMISIEQEDVMFGYSINGLSFVYAFLLTFVFTGIVNIFMIKRLRSVHMVESLKSIE